MKGIIKLLVVVIIAIAIWEGLKYVWNYLF